MLRRTPAAVGRLRSATRVLAVVAGWARAATVGRARSGLALRHRRRWRQGGNLQVLDPLRVAAAIRRGNGPCGPGSLSVRVALIGLGLLGVQGALGVGLALRAIGGIRRGRVSGCVVRIGRHQV
jgi:hypothetical protein